MVQRNSSIEIYRSPEGNIELTITTQVSSLSVHDFQKEYLPLHAE